MPVLRLQRHVNEKDECRLEIISGNIDNVVCATNWQNSTDEEDIMGCRRLVVQMLADLHNMLGNELRIA